MRIMRQMAPYLGSLTWAQLSAITNVPVGTQALVTDWGQPFVFNGTRWTPISGSIQIISSGTVVTLTGTTVETDLATISIPGNLLGATGRIEVECWTSNNNSANNKQSRIRINGNSSDSTLNTTNLSAYNKAFVQNRSTSFQYVGILRTQANLGNIAQTNFVIAVDTASPVTITITGQLAVSTDTISLNSFNVAVKL